MNHAALLADLQRAAERQARKPDAAPRPGLLEWAAARIEELEMALRAKDVPQVRVDGGHQHCGPHFSDDDYARIALAAVEELQTLRECPICNRRRMPPGAASL